MARKKTVWGKPGETGVTPDGIPWYVPDDGPKLMSRVLYTLFPGGGTYMPAGARFLPARTAAEMLQRCMPKYRDGIAKLLGDERDEEIIGFVEFVLDENVPQPPTSTVGSKLGSNPLKQWWMGGDWDSMAGQLNIRLGNSRVRSINYTGPIDRHELWVRTNHRIVIVGGYMENPVFIDAEFGLDQAGIRPGWQPGDPAKGLGQRVDVAFPDGSWLGLQARSGQVPGGTDGHPERDLLAELAGAPVTATVLPARGRG